MDHRAAADSSARAPATPSQEPWRVKWRYASPILSIHLIAALAFVPWFFSWTGVVLAVLGCYVFGTLGMNIGYHRLVGPPSFSCPRWLERAPAILGAGGR